MDKSLNSKTMPKSLGASVMQSDILPQDLRIGNIVYADLYSDTPILVESICSKNNDIFNSTAGEIPFTSLKPIEITEEWLIKIGYQLMPSGTYLQPNSGNFIWFESGLKCSIAGEFCPESIKYIHQLQNLHFALTQRELAVA